MKTIAIFLLQVLITTAGSQEVVIGMDAFAGAVRSVPTPGPNGQISILILMAGGKGLARWFGIEGA